MENNIINETIISEEKYDEYMKKVIEKFKKDKEIYLKGKLLHYLEKPTLFYICTVIANTKYNPFDVDIQFSFEFINGEIPYASILTDFIDPTFKDNRNYYRCLSKDYNYKFYLDKFEQHDKILESMIEGIENFLTYINESIAVNTFIFFGEYEYNHIYQINDFLFNNNYYNFYRINELNNNQIKERYIIFTKLYFLLFAPISEDKALAKLLFFQKLKDLNLIFDKNQENNSLILKFDNKKYKNDLEFVFIDRRKKEGKEELDLVEEEENNEKSEKKEKLNTSIIIKGWFCYIDNINFKTYDIVLSKYKILFKENKRNLKVKEIKSNKIEEYNKYIKFNENLISLYEKLKNNNERINKLISNIIYICSELVDYGNTTNGNENEYLTKIRKYIGLKTNKI